MNKLSCEFINELGNEIVMSVMVDDETLTVSATGPTSEVEHTWTHLEAFWLANLLWSPAIAKEISKDKT